MVGKTGNMHYNVSMFTLTNEVARHSLPLLEEMIGEAPVAIIEGARQVGKSTLSNQLASNMDCLQVTLDDPEVASFAATDPKGFLLQAGDRMLIIDEAQREPSLPLALKSLVDTNRSPGRFLLTGSADFLSVKGIGDSLAGRAEMLTLRPLSAGEIDQRPLPEDWVRWVLNGAEGEIHFETAERTRERVIAGGYPLPLQRESWSGRDRWFSGYLRTMIAKDAKDLHSESFSALLPEILKQLAANPQSEMVRAKMARWLDTNEKTLATYLSLVQSMYLSETLPSWGTGLSGRVSRKPKVGLLDTGMAAYLTGMTVDKSRLAGGMEYFGSLTEQFVASELLKQSTWSSERFGLFHFRQRDNEANIVIELADGRLILVEVKSGLSVNSNVWDKLERTVPQDRVVAKVVLYLGDQVQRRANNCYLLPISSLWLHP